MIPRLSLPRACRAVVVACAALLPGASPAWALDTSAQEAIIQDYQSGTVMFEKNADEPVHPASMSKLMTLYVLFDRL